MLSVLPSGCDAARILLGKRESGARAAAAALDAATTVAWRMREVRALAMTRWELLGERIADAVARRGAAIMGVCNVTPDSFSDGGEHLDLSAAHARVDALVEAGADVVDIGGESTRPGAPPVAAREQIARIAEIVRRAATKAIVSVDTTSPEVARACLSLGAHCVNDVSLLADDGLASAAAEHGAALVLSHARGSQADMAGFGAAPEDGYGADVVEVVASEWEEAARRAEARGVPRAALIMDPGLGFAKTHGQSADLLRSLERLVARVGVPVLVGASRKSFLSLADHRAAPKERLGASVAAALVAVERGATLVRVHDVVETRQALDVARLLSVKPATNREVALAPRQGA